MGGDAVLNWCSRSYDGARACAYASKLPFNGRARWTCCADGVITQSCVVGSGEWVLERSWDVKARTKEEAPDAVVCRGGRGGRGACSSMNGSMGRRGAREHHGGGWGVFVRSSWREELAYHDTKQARTKRTLVPSFTFISSFNPFSKRHELLLLFATYDSGCAPPPGVRGAAVGLRSGEGPAAEGDRLVVHVGGRLEESGEGLGGGGRGRTSSQQRGRSCTRRWSGGARRQRAAARAAARA